MKTAEESLGITSEEYNKMVDDCIFGEENTNSSTMQEKADIDAGFTDMMMKEQKLVESKFKVGDFIRHKSIGYNIHTTIKEVCGTTHYINSDGKRMDMSYTDANFELVEQKYGKPKFKVGDTITLREGIPCIEENKGKEYTISSIKDGIYLTDKGDIYVSAQNNFELVEQKSVELTKEDECIRGVIIDYLKDNNLTEWADWLKSVNCHCIPQQKCEWCEEDEKTIEEAAECLEKYAEYVQGGNSKRYVLDLASRLESLCPQNYWKPTEEQLKALEKVSLNKTLKPEQYDILVDLYNKLKKL